ncbi:hypothetical protein HYZ06_02495 [Candidatus Daviesbacteria bacterium]|nr:hypothetical protein [Candidatus Daviesbacteria bacterium]
MNPDDPNQNPAGPAGPMGGGMPSQPADQPADQPAAGEPQQPQQAATCVKCGGSAQNGVCVPCGQNEQACTCMPSGSAPSGDMGQPAPAM